MYAEAWRIYFRLLQQHSFSSKDQHNKDDDSNQSCYHIDFELHVGLSGYRTFMNPHRGAVVRPICFHKPKFPLGELEHGPIPMRCRYRWQLTRGGAHGHRTYTAIDALVTRRHL